VIAYVHDGSIDGRLCALAAALEGDEPPESIQMADGGQPSLFAEEVAVESNGDVAAALIRNIRGKISREATHHVMHVLLSELPNLDLPLYFYLREGLARGKAVDRWHANRHVKAVHEASMKVSREIHRLKGLLRFRELEDGTLWAPVEPDYRVLLPLAFHFRRRLPGERGVIHDLRRGIAAGWSGSGVEYLAPPAEIRMADGEDAAQRLWQTYFDAATIRERVNPRLQRQCMPVRYWKWLTEIQVDA